MSTASDRSARVIAFYLPQFHPIPENDRWWGEGFTEWTNVRKARPLYPGHLQPRVPTELGYYDLRDADVRDTQAALARDHGVEGFCYWHYWFGGGKRLLQRPLEEVIRAGRPDLGFCVAWANTTWSGAWFGASDQILMRQTYPGRVDDEAHFQALLPAFADPRYLTVNDRKLVLVYAPRELPKPKRFADTWRELASKAGLEGLYLVGMGGDEWDPIAHGFDATVSNVPSPFIKRASGKYRRAFKLNQVVARGALRPVGATLRRLRGATRARDTLDKLVRVSSPWIDQVTLRCALPLVLPYDEIIVRAPPHGRWPVIPTVLPNWDNTPRSGRLGIVLEGSSPAAFGRDLDVVLDQVASQPIEQRIVFLRSWNEWAEGNYVEPDSLFGRGYLETIRARVLPR